ncbi:DUF6286 domain-containing protein [Streptomyces sp. Act143]|uniref:DUF6286 domain-containing protein n=1 Tax=Streptomyces sp. Act143 TaxID=2200760 RepID=UPI0015E80073|nr:DUF6286 domain-containing protein [Streptomyces sp. Act143]
MTTAAERGTTTVTDRAVRRIAERAAGETLTGEAATRPAKAAASVHGGRAQVALDVALPYPAPLTETVRGLQEHVAFRTRELTGLDVPTAGIRVTSLAAATGDGVAGGGAAGGGAAGGGATTGKTPSAAVRTPRRLWSRRRIPAALLAAVATVACGALAVDLILVHAAHRPAAGWRVAVVHWASEHGPGDRSVVLAGALTALLGLWMVVLAVTPGLRRRPTAHAPGPRVVAAVDRSAVEALVRDAVGEVAGVGAVRVRVRRRRASARAVLLFGERARVRAEVAAAAGAALTSCGLRLPLKPRVRVTPSAVWRPPAPEGEAPAPSAAPGTGAVPEGEV